MTIRELLERIVGVVMRQQSYLQLSKSECRIVNDWFGFVENAERTKVDCKLSIRIKNAIESGDLRYGELIFNEHELIIISRWYGKCPDAFRDPHDIIAFGRIEQFITELAS